MVSEVRQKSLFSLYSAKGATNVDFNKLRGIGTYFIDQKLFIVLMSQCHWDTAKIAAGYHSSLPV